MPMNVQPQTEDEKTASAVPLSANHRAVVDELVKREAARKAQTQQDFIQAGARLATNDPRTPQGMLSAVREAVNALTYDDGSDVVLAMVANPRHAIARYVARIYPKLYRFLQATPTEHHFQLVSPKTMERKVGKASVEGYSQPSMPGDQVTTAIRSDLFKTLQDPVALEALRQTDPKKYRMLVSLVPHEVMHGVYTNARQAPMRLPTGRTVRLPDRAGSQGMPFKPGSASQEQFLNNMAGVDAKTGQWAPRHLPDHINQFAVRYAKKGIDTMAGEGLVQRAAENSARQAGLLTRNEIKSDLAGDDLRGLRELLRQAFPGKIQALP